MLVPRLRASLFVVVILLLSVSCVQPFGRQYEYDEEIYLTIDGSATVIVNSSLPALAALHGLDVPLDAMDRVDRDAIRAAYESPVTRVSRVSRPWRRSGRRFVQVRLEVADIRQLSAVAPFASARYEFGPLDDSLRYVQVLERPAAREIDGVGWRGDEMVAVRLHIPSRVTFHNSPTREVERGNIVRWEQSLDQRMAGDPLRVEVVFGTQRILVLTIVLFLAAMTAAALTLVGLIWWVVRLGRQAR
jgi:hypothetical protein